MSSPPPVGRADLHIHPSGNGPSRQTTAAVYAAVLGSGLQIAVLADHDRVDVAQALVRRSRDEGSPVVLEVGEEISSAEGHVVGIGLTTLVPQGLSLPETIAAVHDQGGIAVVAHPLLPPHLAAPARRLVELAQAEARYRPDALETMHPLAAWVPGWQRRVERLAARCGYATVGGSDAHAARVVGCATTCFHGDSLAALAAAIQDRRTWTEGRRYPVRYILRELGR